MAQVAVTTPDDRHDALRVVLADLLAMDEPRKHLAGALSGLDIHYDLGEGHPLLGRRIPDLDLQTETGPTRAFTLLHKARPVLLSLGKPGAFELASWSDRVDLVEATHKAPWELPVIGEVDPPEAILIRPDGHVAWTGPSTDPSLHDALNTWFGPATSEP
jgi:hypothetical protein